MEFNPSAKIVFASLTGNTEEIAEVICDALTDLNVDVTMANCDEAEACDFQDVDICVVATYTYGDGDLPDEIVDFYEDLADEDLDGKVYGVAGSGDTTYDHFCKSVEDFDAQFASTGAIKGAENVKVELEPEAEDIQHLEAFAKSLVEKAQELHEA